MMTSGHDVDGFAGPLLSLDAAARRLGISRRWLEMEVARGALPTVRLGRRRLIRPADLDVYVSERVGTRGSS
jgi:excisionase family DNA binding protein